ncbi:unnamed protein product [Rotaria socialis]
MIFQPGMHQFLVHANIPANDKWTQKGVTIAGGHGQDSATNQLDRPLGLFVDDDQTVIIADYSNNRIIGTAQGKILIGDIKCWGLAMDEQRYLYVSDYVKHEVRRYKLGEKEGIVVAGGQETRNALTQLSSPNGIFVDTLGTLYVADTLNDRLMRWTQGDKKQGTVVVGGNG